MLWHRDTRWGSGNGKRSASQHLGMEIIDMINWDQLRSTEEWDVRAKCDICKLQVCHTSFLYVFAALHLSPFRYKTMAMDLPALAASGFESAAESSIHINPQRHEIGGRQSMNLGEMDHHQEYWLLTSFWKQHETTKLYQTLEIWWNL